MAYAIVKNSLVTNIVEWDGVSEYNVDGELIQADENAWIGGTYNGSFVARPIEPYTETYTEKRAAAYAPLGDQLDMQYWDSINGTTTWHDHVKEIKTRFPK
jgi:hypothetical protein